MSCNYRIYCSKCNSISKSNMSWAKYLYYMSSDSKSKGYYDIQRFLWEDEPTQCPNGHDIDVKRTKVTISNDIDENKK